MKKILAIYLSLLTLSVGIAACGTMKGYTVCVADPFGKRDGRKGIWCSKDGGADFFRSYEESENDVSMPFDDAKSYFKSCYDPRRGH